MICHPKVRGIMGDGSAMNEAVDLLYVHPHGHLHSDWLVPVGALTTVNAAACRKLGVFSWQCTDEQIRTARIVALDWYWYFSLGAVRAIVQRVRRINPGAPIVLGGLTASWFGRRVFDLLPVDYVAIGDCEAGITRLVEMGDRKSRYEVPPNFLRSDGKAGPSRILDQEEFDQLDPVSVDWFPSLVQSRLAPFLMLVRGCHASCRPICISRDVCSSPMRVHSAHWLASIVRKAQKTLSPGATIRMMNFGAHDESSLIGILDELAGDSSVGPLVIFTYGLNRDFLDYVLACCPTAVIGVLSTWETLGWPYREVSDLEAIGAVEPVEHFAGRLRSGAHARLDYYIHHRFLDRCPEIIGRVRSDRTTILPSESFYIWVPEFQATSDAEARQQTARMEAMGDLGARTLLVEKLVPGLMTLYPMRADPHSRPAPEPPRPGLAGFHRLVLEGWRRWNLQVPDPFDFEVHWVPKPLGSGSKADMRPSLPALSESHPVMNGAVLQTTEKGVELYWDSRGRLTPPGDATALIVLPRHISEYVGAQPIDLMCFPVPPRTRGKSLRLWLRVDPLGIEWEVAWKKSGSWSGRFESP